jgi:hypothetical protein
MFDSLNRYFSDLENSANDTKEFIRKLRGGVTRLSNGIVKAEQEVKEARNERNYVAKLKLAYKKEAIQLAKTSLFDATANAIKKRQEFDIPLYKNAIYEAVLDNDTYLYRPTGSGFNSILKVDIDLNRTAGRLNMWGTAVKRTRAELGVKIPSKHSRKEKREKAALQASRAWAGIYNRRGSANSKYMQTIKKRMENAAKAGSWWELLDKGTISIPSSDRGGYATPKNAALNFVDRIEKETNESLLKSFEKEKEKYSALLGNYDSIISGAYQTLEEVSNLVNEISLDSKKIQGLSKRAEKLFKVKYEEKLAKAIKLIEQGLLSTKKLDLAIKGSYRGKRFSNETLQELLQL